MTRSVDVVWHDLECGAYRADLALWSALARAGAGPVLDIGAGSGRVSLHLAGAGHAVTALDRDPALIDALRQRAWARSLTLDAVCADARDFSLPAPVALAIVPMQTVQLLADASERRALLRCARSALRPGGRLALAIVDALEPFALADGEPGPLADVTELDGTVYSSRPVAVRAEDGGWVLERLHETVGADGTLDAELDRVALRSLDAETLEAEGRAEGLTPAPRAQIAATSEHVGSTVVILDA